MVINEAPGGFRCEVVADSLHNGNRITTLQLRYPRFIHSEFMTHRMFSRNASSSRAIPAKKIRESVEANPARPIHWGKNQSGMQAKSEIDNDDKVVARAYWSNSSRAACLAHKGLESRGVHKQVANRILEPFTFIDVIVTATEWDNFFKLRLHEDAQPEIRELARIMKKSMDESTPLPLMVGYWHVPYISGGVCDDWEHVLASAARCARVSYRNHDQSDPVLKKDIELATRLVESGHMSPFEHQATPLVVAKGVSGITHFDIDGMAWSGNFKGFIQLRQTI